MVNIGDIIVRKHDMKKFRILNITKKFTNLGSCDDIEILTVDNRNLDKLFSWIEVKA